MDGASTAECEELIVTGAVEDVDGVRQEMGNGFERFDCASRAAGKINDDGVGAYGGDRAGQDGGGSFFHSFATHFFGDPRDEAVGDSDGGLRGVIAGADAGSAGGEDNIRTTPVGDGAELFANGGWIVRDAQRFGDFPAEAAAERNDCGTGGVLAVAFGGGVADSEDGYAHVRKASAI
jgi:hypothetical protein